MKLITYVLSFLLFLMFMDVSAQSTAPSKIVLSVSQPKVYSQLPSLPTEHLVEKLANPSLPLLRIPPSYYKQYVIRVLQLEHRALKQNLDVFYYLFSAKSKDHDGYDYYLPVAFKKKEWGEAYTAKLPRSLKEKAVLLRLVPNDQKCNCFSKF